MDPALPDDVSDESSSGTAQLEYHFNPEVPRILVVDDEKVIREILSDFLTPGGLPGPRGRGRRGGAQGAAAPQLQPGHLRSEDAQHGRPRADRADHPPADPGAHGDHDRLRHGRDRHRGDEAGRLRLHPQAVQGRGGRAHRPARARPAAPAAREPAPQGRAVDLPDQRGHRDLAVGREGARPGARRHPGRHRRRRGQPAARRPRWPERPRAGPTGVPDASSSRCARPARAPIPTSRRRR